jgi:16S rRNA G966 N2-methylase RsmD
LNLEKKSSYTALKKRFAEQIPFDIVFLDPPYEQKMAETALTMIEKTGLVATKGVVIAEERWKVSLPKHLGSLELYLDRRYGETRICIYKKLSRQTVQAGTKE